MLREEFFKFAVVDESRIASLHVLNVLVIKKMIQDKFYQ